MSVYIYLFLISRCIQIKSSANVWHTISNVNLPAALHGHALGIYNNTLFIIGGSHSSTQEPFSTKLYYKTIYNYNITNYTNILLNNSPSPSPSPSYAWKSIANMVDGRYYFGFKCKGQCYTFYNQYLFIINAESMFSDYTGYLLIYNMATYQFIDPILFNNTLIYLEAGICATNNNTHIFAIGSKCIGCRTAHKDIQIYEIDTSGPWTIAGNMSIGRYYSGCTVDTHGYLYIFGGYLNHNRINDTGDVCNYIEKCDLFEGDEIICSNLTQTQLNIARAQHQVITNKNNLIFIIGGYNDQAEMIEIVEIFQDGLILNNEWFTYIRHGINEFATFYDETWDVLYIIGGIDNTLNVLSDIKYFPVCQLYDNCYTPPVTDNILSCYDTINVSIAYPHDLHSYYFSIASADNIISLHFNSCLSDIDTYVFLFIWNETLNDWHSGYLTDWQWDDNGGCNGIHSLKQESFTINNVQNGDYHLVISAHDIGNYHAHFSCTFKTTSNPTSEPTDFPTEMPTNLLTYTESPTYAQTDDYDAIFFILSFVCESFEDLSLMDWESLILNGLLNAFKPDLKFILHTQIAAKLIFLENETDAIHTINNGKKRQLLRTSGEVIFYYDIKANISIDVVYLNGNNISSLCQPTFSIDFVEGLALHRHINKAQIYALAKCQNTLQNTWNGKEKNNESTKNAYDYIAIITLLSISILIIFIANLIQELRGIDSLNIFKLLLFIIYFVSAYFDLFFAANIWIFIVTHSFNISYLIMGIISLCIVIIPFIKNLYDINIFAEHCQSDFVHGILITNWLNTYGKFVYFLSFICCTTYGAIMLVNCNLFGIRLFCMGLPPHLHQQLSKQRFWVILLANIPQLILQIILIFFIDESVNIYGLSAMMACILSIICYIFHIFVGFNYNDPSCQSILLSCRISSITIGKKANYFGNKCVKKLDKYFSTKLQIDSSNERLHILPSMQYFDVDIGGLTMYILISTKLTNKNVNYYLNELKTIIDDNSFSEQIQLLWNLAVNEEINISQLKGIKNTCSASMQMTFIKIKEKSAKFKLSRHIKVNSESVQIQKNTFNYNDDDWSDSDGNENEKHKKNKKDFVAVDNNDAYEHDMEIFDDDKNVKNGTESQQNEYEKTAHQDLL